MLSAAPLRPQRGRPTATAEALSVSSSAFGSDRGLPAEDGRRRRPPAGPALRRVEKDLTKLTSTDATERNAGMLLAFYASRSSALAWK